MECQQCGVPVQSGWVQDLCPACTQKRLDSKGAGAKPYVKYRVAIGIHKLLCVIHLFLVVSVVASLTLNLASADRLEWWMAAFVLGLAGLHYWIARGLLNERAWAAGLALLCAGLLLLAFPLGTLLGALSIYSIVKTWYF